MRSWLPTLLVCLVAVEVAAQPGATGPVAALNAEAKALSDTDPDKSLALAQKAQAAARESRDTRGEAEALNYVAYGFRAQSLLDRATELGAEVRMPARALAVHFAADGVDVEVQQDGVTTSLRAKALIDASGRDGFLAKRQKLLPKRHRLRSTGCAHLFYELHQSILYGEGGLRSRQSCR